MQGSCSAPASPAACSSLASAWDSGSPLAQFQSSSTRAAAAGSPLQTATSAAPDGAVLTSRSAAAVGSDELMQRSASPLGFPEPARSNSPLTLTAGVLQQQVQQEGGPTWQPGVKHAGWLWRRFGHGHKTKWKRLWFYLEDDRLCYCQPDKLAGSSSSSSATAGISNGAYSSMGLGSTCVNSSYALMSSYTARSTAGGTSSTAGSAAALAAGQIKYIALDRIPVRPLPQRQHGMDPMRKSHPDIGLAIIDARVLTGQPQNSPERTVFSLVAGSHTHYLAAETLREAQLWVSAIRETWLHCFAHTARKTTSGSSGVVVAQRLMAENAQLRESMQELNQKLSQSDYEYWRKWVEEKSKNQVLESKLINAATYEVLVNTGSMKGAQTSARVYIELYGPDYSPTAAAASVGLAATGQLAGIAGSGEVRLLDIDSHVKPFGKGALDSFTVLCHNVGLPARLKVWHDNTGCHPDWFLVEIKVRKKGARDWVCFPCNRWLSTQLEDGRICRDLVGGASRPQIAYQVVTYTSDVRGAGTDAVVSIQLHGLLGDGHKQQLLGGPNDFDRGQRNEFTVEDADLGELTAVTISHDGSGSSPAWHLSHIEVTPLACPLYGSPNNLCAAAAAGKLSSPTGSTSSTPLGCSMKRSWHLNSSLLSRSAELGARDSRSMRIGQGGLKEGVVYLFPCDAWLDERLGDGRIERRLQAASPGDSNPDSTSATDFDLYCHGCSSLNAKSWYTLHITTSDVRGAGTDADVHVVLMGSEGTSDRLQLPSKPENFERGCKDTTRLQMPHLGQLQKLLIGHNGRGNNPSWHLALVEVVEEDTGRVTYFAADRWVAAAAGDGLSEVTLTASSTDPRKALADYQVCFLTSALRGAGTDSTVSFELYGDRGSSGPITIACGREAFERGGSDSFTYARPWLGQLQRLVVWHDDAGAAAGRGPWHLEAVEVTCSRDQQVVNFPCNRWLSAETQLKVELQPGRAMGLTRYQFDVVTSNVRGAGTDGALQVELLSSSSGTATAALAAATAGPWCLDRSGAFARGTTDTFIVEGVQIGKLAFLKVSLQGASLNPDWHLSHIVCTILDGVNDVEGAKYYFSAERWFDAAHGFQATLPCSLKPPGRPDEGQLPYIIKVFTSNVKGAGTDANVLINIMGLKGQSGWQQLPARQETFERGREDSFTLKLPDLGALTHLAIKSDCSGEGPAWHLDKVCIIPPATTGSHSGAGRTGTAAASGHISRAASFVAKNAAESSATLLINAASELAGTAAAVGPGAAGFGANGQPVWFVARRWLDPLHGLEVVLEAQGVDPAKNLVTYEVEVYTSDLKNAGTDARVFIQLAGDKASSPPHELQDPVAPADCFLRGGSDGFALQLPRLGQLSTARVWLDGPGSPWHLQLIVVTGPDGDTVYFPCSAWLRLSSAADSSAAGVGSAAQPMELQATKQDPRQCMREYKVVTRTSNVQGAATDAAVYAEIIGRSGATSGRQPLTPAHPQAFERGSVDEFRLFCADLGQVEQLCIGHDQSGRQPAWHLSQVEVTDIAAGKTWYFEADCWLDAAQGDGKTELLLNATTTDPLAVKRVYQVTVYTSNAKGSSTTGAVYVTLHGSKGLPVACAPSSSSGGSLMSPRQQPSAALSPAAARVTLSIPKTPRGAASSINDAVSLLSSGRHALCGKDSTASRAAFADGGVGSFTLPPVKSLGQLWQLTLELESGTGEPCTWHCQHLEVLCTSSDERWLFPCNAWLAAAGNSGRTAVAANTSAAPATAGPQLLLYPAPSLDSMWQQIQEQQQEDYQVAVYTSDMSGAGTNAASVSVTLLGAAGEAGPFKLSAANCNCFERGTCDVFNIQTAAKLGQLLKLKVKYDGPGLASAWHLDTIAVTNKSTGAVTWFYAGRCVSSGVRAEALLQGDEIDVRQQLVRYKVTTYTGDVQGAGTDANVYVDIKGTSDCTGPQELSKSSSCNSNTFERGQADIFVLKCKDCGELTELLVWHDNSGQAAGWNLAYIEVQQIATGQIWFFPCGKWLDSSQGDKATSRTLTATKTFDPASLLCTYRISVATGDVRGAGTDANVFVSIHGMQGDTGRKVLAKQGRNCFERGQHDEFKVSAADVGEMTHVIVEHDAAGVAAAWHLAELEVQHMGTGQVLKFAPNRWFDAKRPGGSLQCELWPESQSQQGAAVAHSQQQVQWELLVITGKVLGAGTDADVFITLKGSSGSFGPYTLPAGPEAFETGCTDTFKFATPDIGKIQEFIIGHNNMGMAAAWFLQGLELLNSNTGAKYTFKVAAWLNVQNGCCRTLKPVQQNPQTLVTGLNAQPLSSCSYQVEIQTSDIEGAGTDAVVFIQLAGNAGESDAVQLQATGSRTGITTRALFQRGSLDVFILRGLPCLGNLAHITIGHDGVGSNSAWHLAWVRVVNLTSSDRALFAANCWLDSSLPGSNNWVQLPAGPDSAADTAGVPASSPQQQPGQLSRPGVFGASGLKEHTEWSTGSLKLMRNWMHVSRLGQPGYKVTFATSNVIGAGTAAKVFFELIGEHGSTGVVYPANQPEQFQRGHQDVFLYPRLPYIGQMYQLRVGCDGSGIFAAWHLRQVEVVHVHTGQRWLFDCHDWIDKKCAWQRVLPAAPAAAAM